MDCDVSVKDRSTSVPKPQRESEKVIKKDKSVGIGIIKYVDTSLSEKELLELISPVFGEIIEVLSVKRFTKKIDSDKYLPTSTIMVTFRGQKLPSQVAICKVACAVEPYVQRVIQCFNCLRYGHVSKQCRSEIRCKKCGDNHHSDKCQSFTPLACIFCKGSHNATDHKICPEYKKQRAIKQLMATENISYKDAKIVQNNSYAGVVTLPVPPINNNNFPLLDENRNKRKRPMTIEKNFNFEEYNEIIRNPSDNSGNGPNGANIDSSDWEKFLKSVNSPCLVGGDFNVHNIAWDNNFTDVQGQNLLDAIENNNMDVHNIAWDNNFTDVQGQNLLDAIENNNMVILNDGSHTRLANFGQRNSAVDVSICSPDIALSLNWRTVDDTLGSDHLVIQITLQNHSTSNTFMPNHQWNLKKADWSKFSSIMNQWNLKKADWSKFSSIMNTLTEGCSANNDFTYDNFIANINTASSMSVPRYNTNRPPKSTYFKHWWNLECQQAILDRKAALNNYYNNPTPENFMHYKKSVAVAKRVVLKSKRDSWQKYCSSLNKDTPIKSIWCEIKKIKFGFHGNKQPRIKGSWSNHFLDSLAPPTVENFLENSHYYTEHDHFFQTTFTFEELNMALQSIKKTSTPCLDLLPYEFLINLPQNAKMHLLAIYNNILLHGNVPCQWKDYTFWLYIIISYYTAAIVGEMGRILPNLHGWFGNTHAINSEFRQLLLERWEEYYLIYTDGSGIEAAYGCVYDKQREYTQSFRLKDTASVYTAELVAIYEYTAELVAIYESLKYINRLNIENNILVISSKYREQHTGHEFKEQFLTGTTGLFHKSLQQDAQEKAWYANETNTTGLFHKSLQQDAQEKAWYANETNRNFIRTMSRLRSNHGICKSYLMKIKLADSDSCLCGSVETLEHLILTCPVYNDYRRIFFYKLTAVYNDYRRIFFYKLTKLTEHPFNYNTLLGSNDTGIYKEMYKFLANCKINVRM
ncbi:Endonuclease-reverse transcriptase [Popillia japonica]|uniref:Endonuclease-reverse transcriptase n=1 Tax=Popillia japonica TaxID=7064 RepID=A0AAW1K4Z9_POPJA